MRYGRPEAEPTSDHVKSLFGVAVLRSRFPVAVFQPAAAPLPADLRRCALWDPLHPRPPSARRGINATAQAREPRGPAEMRTHLVHLDIVTGM